MASLVLRSDGAFRRYLRNFNWTLALPCAAIALLGVLCVQSAGLHDPGAA